VLRRAPSGPLLSPTAHRVDREFTILAALNAYNKTTNSKVPVPEVFCLCMDVEVIGASFYVMDFIKGRIFQDVRMPSIDHEQRRAW
jgi:aminoglycoside phosphotransferase (APT) family kinase protein